MRIKIETNTGGGYSREVDLPEGTTVFDFLRVEIGRDDLDAFTIRVNRKNVTPTDPLRDGDRVIVAPRNIKGAFTSPASPPLSDREREDLDDLEAIERSRSEGDSIPWETLKAELGL